LLMVVISFSLWIYHFPRLYENLAFYSICLAHQKLAGNIRGDC
jgi:hypothetical protein